MQNRYEIFECLGIKPVGINIRKFEVQKLFTQLAVHCSYDAEHEKPFTLVFRQCQKIHCSIHDGVAFKDFEFPNVVSDVLGIHPGESAYKATAYIHTTDFEVSILYNTLEIIQP